MQLSSSKSHRDLSTGIQLFKPPQLTCQNTIQNPQKFTELKRKIYTDAKTIKSATSFHMWRVQTETEEKRKGQQDCDPKVKTKLKRNFKPTGISKTPAQSQMKEPEKGYFSIILPKELYPLQHKLPYIGSTTEIDT